MLICVHIYKSPPPPDREGRGGVQVARMEEKGAKQVAAGIYTKHSVGPSIRPICTRRCLTMTNMVQACYCFELEYLS